MQDPVNKRLPLLLIEPLCIVYLRGSIRALIEK
jgi:hypothetical protein